MAASLNVCLISREFPPDTAFGGIATFSCDTALMLREQGHRVTVLSQSLGPSRVDDFRGIPVVKCQVPRPFGSYRCLPLFIPAYNAVIMREVLRRHEQQPFDLIDVPDHLAEGLFATRSGIPVVTRLHTPYAMIVAMGLNAYQRDFSYQAIKAMERSALRRSCALYAPCEDLVERCDALFGLGDIPVKIFGYPLDLDQFAPRGSAGNMRPRRILFVGRFEQRKGIETMVAAFPQLLVRYPDCTLTLVGNDTPNIRGFSSARQYMESEFARARCLDRVHFAPAVPLAKLPAIFHEHDIVWVPSLYDNYPLICLEAMACGKAVVVADSGGLPEMVSDGETGLVFPAGNATALGIATSALCEDASLVGRLGEAARGFTERHCSIGTIYGETMDLYHLALDRHAGTGKARR